MTQKAKISACLIVKNDPIGLEECLKSFKDYVDEIVVVDTGSTDGKTQEIAKKYANRFEIFTDCNDPITGVIENFSMARKRSFDLAKNDAVLWIDSDDILAGAENLSKILQEAKNIEPAGGSICFLFPYEYSYDDKGNCTCLHYRERLVTNKNHLEWLNPVHEVLCPKDNSKVLLINREDLTFKHRRQYFNKPIDPNRNLRILKKFVENNGENDFRQLYYLGLEYCNVGQFNESIHYLTKYIDGSGWPDEAAMACLKLVDIHQALNNFKEGLKWAFKTIEIKHNWGEGYFAAARMFYFLALANPNTGHVEQSYWERCAYFAKTGLSFPPTKTLLFINPLDRESEIHKYLNMALNKLGDVKGALDSINTGILKSPTDPHFVNNKRVYEEHIARQNIIIDTNKLKELGTINQSVVEMITKLIHNTPFNFNIPVDNVKEIIPNQEVKIVSSQDITDKLSIIFCIGDGVEIWTPDTVKNSGIGGSETMAMEMAKNLAALGHNVSVYNSCGTESIYDNVKYYPTHMYQNLECDVLIVSRNAQMLDDKFNVQAKLKLLWVHDVCILNATNTLLLKADRILALSNWHKQNLVNTHNLHPDHIIVTRNGIKLDRFNKKIDRNKYRAINSSSPDRSWPILLDCWKRIKEKVPKAELHLFYGFKNWEAIAQYYPGQPELIARIKQHIKELEPYGVVFHDRVSQNQLAEEFLRSGVWAYPTWFTETSCITAMEAQAAGLRIVSSNIAALNETVADRGVLIDGDWTTLEYQNKFISYVVEAMNKNDGSDRIKLQNYAKENFELNKLAEDWQTMFYSLIEELKINPIVPYQPTVRYR